MTNQQVQDASTDDIEQALLVDHPRRKGAVILGRYTVEKTLGQGGMGIVVAARHHYLEELHAIKFLLPGTKVSARIAERFLREARAAARLKNEHVVRVLDLGMMENNHLFMVMEYLDGMSLKAAIAQGPLPIDEVVTCILQVCEALTEAHDAGIIHRDLKPANLHLQRDDNGAVKIKVLDFGIAKFLGASLSTEKEILGTLLYMSPEHYFDSKSIDRRTDIWALGVIAYELLTATRPFTGYSALEIAMAVEREEPVLPSRLRSDLPKEIEDVVLRCLRKNRNERYSTARELAEALRKAFVMAYAKAPTRRAMVPKLPGTIPEIREEKAHSQFAPSQNTSIRKGGRWKIMVTALSGVLTLTIASVLVNARVSATTETRNKAPIVAHEAASIAAPSASEAPEPPAIATSASPSTTVSPKNRTDPVSTKPAARSNHPKSQATRPMPPETID